MFFALFLSNTDGIQQALFQQLLNQRNVKKLFVSQIVIAVFLHISVPRHNFQINK